MTKVNPNNGNQTKSDIFSWDIFKYDIFSLVAKYFLESFNLIAKMSTNT